MKEYPKELSDLVGEAVLETVPFMEVRHPFDPDASGVLFTLSDRTYMVFEDSNDGYRSSAGALISYPGGPYEIGYNGANITHIQEPVICSFTDVDDILEMRSKETGILIFSVGTSNVDDYYPSFECYWNPEGLSKNAKGRL